MSKLLDKLIKTGNLDSAILKNSKYFGEREYFNFEVPIMNVACSGTLAKGMCSGITTIAAPPKHFKSQFHLMVMRSYLDAYKDGVVVFYDNEFGTPLEYFAQRGVDPERVIHTPFATLDNLRNDMYAKLESLERGKDRVLFVVDSLGQATTQKQVEDAAKNENKDDLKRPKALRDLFRLIGPYPVIKDIPIVFINHTYKEMNAYVPTNKIGGGEGVIYASDNVWLISKKKDKNGQDVTGNIFTINIAFSRKVREGSKFEIEVSYENGVNKYSGIWDLALETKAIVENGKGWYSFPSNMEKKFREKDLNVPEVLDKILADPSFQKYVEDKYRLCHEASLDEGASLLDDSE